MVYEARKRGIEVIIAAAGGAAHLPGVLASWSSLPVIGVPLASGELKGVDALYSIVYSCDWCWRTAGSRASRGSWKKKSDNRTYHSPCRNKQYRRHFTSCWRSH